MYTHNVCVCVCVYRQQDLPFPARFWSLQAQHFPSLRGLILRYMAGAGKITDLCEPRQWPVTVPCLVAPDVESRCSPSLAPCDYSSLGFWETLKHAQALLHVAPWSMLPSCIFGRQFFLTQPVQAGLLSLLMHLISDYVRASLAQGNTMSKHERRFLTWIPSNSTEGAG